MGRMDAGSGPFTRGWCARMSMNWHYGQPGSRAPGTLPPGDPDACLGEATMGAEASDRLVIGGRASVYALLTDGTTIDILAATPGVLTLVKAMHQALSPEKK